LVLPSYSVFYLELVDAVARQDGGVASLFVKSGNQFARVDTNATKDNGSRALGGRVRRSRITRGEEPIHDASGDVIGIYATGYVKPSAPR